MSDNKDIAVLAKKVYELSVLPVDALDARKWEALLILNAVYSSATPEGIDKANADKAARWGAAIEQEGLLSRMHPKWHLRTDDGKPPAARHALESALSNPARDLRARLATLQFIAPADRPPLGDLARALISDAFNGAKGEARSSTSTSCAAAARTGFASPGRSCSREGEPPPVMLLIDNQGATHDGGIYDDDDDSDWDRSAGPTRSAPGTSTSSATTRSPALHDDRGRRRQVVETAGQVAEGANEAAKGIATLLKWAPYVLAGIGAIGATAVVLAAVKQRSTTPRADPTP
jgi:hypothetical protein